jgi:hypothetical protein
VKSWENRLERCAEIASCFVGSAFEVYNAAGVGGIGSQSNGLAANEAAALSTKAASGVAGATQFEAAEGAAQGATFSSFGRFKYWAGPAGESLAGESLEWHHIVEQTPTNLERFGAGPIQNTGNLIPLEYSVHREISGFYSSVQRFSEGLTVRDWLSTQSFEQQRQFGLNVLSRFGVLP